MIEFGRLLTGPAEPPTRMLVMSRLNDLIRVYCSILDEERELNDHKERLRMEITEEMAREKLQVMQTPFGSAQRTSRFKLHPKRESVLGLLSGDDIFPFANFTPARVKELLVPKYGRETLIPLFDIEKIESLMVKRPRGGLEE
jgi:hypothetical protein